MSPERGDIEPGRDDADRDRDLDQDHDYGAGASSSLFSTTWFRATVAAATLAVVAIVALPYILDWLRPPEPASTAAPQIGTPPAEPPVAQAAAPPAPGSSPPAPGSETPPSAAVPAATAPPVAPPSAMAEPPLPPTSAWTMKEQPQVEPQPPTVTPAKAERPMSAEKRPSNRVSQSAAPGRPGDEAGARPRTQTAAVAKGSPAGRFWVQVGAFGSSEHARFLVAKLKTAGFSAEQLVPASRASKSASAPPPDTASLGGPSDKYDVFVTGASPEEIGSKLAAKGLAADPTPSGAVITPSLPLRDAVTLSKDLAAEGLKVQVRRASGPTRPGAGEQPASTGAGGDSDGLYRVRVGGFADRPAAEAARKALAAQGHTGFVTQSGE